MGSFVALSIAMAPTTVSPDRGVTRTDPVRQDGASSAAARSLTCVCPQGGAARDPAPAVGSAVSAESVSVASAPRPLTSVAITFVRNPEPRRPAANETGKPAPIPAKTSTAPTDIP